MDKQKLILYYTYFIPITILQSVSSILLMSVLSVENYGTFTLYLSLINLFFFLTFGIQNGYTLVSKQQEISPGITTKIANFVAVISFIFVGFVLISVFTTEMPMYKPLAVSSAIINVMYIFHKSIFRTSMKIHALNIYIIAFRLIVIVDIIIYLLFREIEIMLLADVVMRSLLAVTGTIVINLIYPGSRKVTTKKMFATLKRIVIAGMPIMIGNWLISIYSILDKTFLAGNQNLLGLYSFAITSVLLVRVILIPLSEMNFVTLNSEESNQRYLEKLNRVWKISSVIVVVSGCLAIISLNYLGIFTKYLAALPSLLVLLNILPLSAALDIYIYNYLRRINGRAFLIRAAIGSALAAVILFIYTTFFQVNLAVYSGLVYITYLIIYVMFIKTKLPTVKVVSMMLKNFGFAAVVTIVWMIIL